MILIFNLKDYVLVLGCHRILNSFPLRAIKIRQHCILPQQATAVVLSPQITCITNNPVSSENFRNQQTYYSVFTNFIIAG